MKTTIKNSLVVMAMLGVITSYANLTPPNATNADLKMTVVSLKNVRVGQRLLIKSRTGTILYKESISKTGAYEKEFDLTSLPDGNYFFELEKDLEIQIIPFKVTGNNVEFLKEKEEILFKPFIRSEANKLYVSKLSLGLEPLNIDIYYENADGTAGYERIYSDKIENTQVIERIYSLEKEKKGSYKVVTKTEGRTYTQIVTM